MALSIKKFFPHFLVILGFIAISLAYFSPLLQGKVIYQNDIVQFIGMSKQQKDFKAKTGEETYWTNAAFGGMPTYQLGARYPHHYIKELDSVLRFLPRPADYLFLYFIGFYIFLLALKVDFKLAAVGALAFGFSTYLIIILGVGHNSKAHAIAYMPLVLGGIVLVFRKKYILGFLLTTVAMGLELVANHFQMTYYLMFLVFILGVAYLVDAYKKKLLPHYFKSVGIIAGAVLLSIALNATNILATNEYVKESKRSQSELSINADGSPKMEVTSGLGKDYITQFSYGYWETFNLFIPRFMGGGNGEDVGKESATYEAFRKLGATPIQALEQVKHAPMYWGDQPIVEAPAYIGAVVVFLFVFALFLIKGRLKWWLLGGTLFSLLLSYGKNLGFLTDFFIDYVPFYSKFRAVTSIQVILELCVPALAIFGLVELFKNSKNREEKLRALKYTTAITGGLALVFLLFKSSLFDFVGANDGFYRQNYGLDFVDALKKDRKTLFIQDTLRSLVLVMLAAGTIFMFLREKWSDQVVTGLFCGLVLFDLAGVGKRYVNKDDFVPSMAMAKPFTATEVDKYILDDPTYFRVFDLISGPSKPSYFHNSLNGYNAAELRRYSEVFDFYISRNHFNVLSMLNTKYIVTQDEQGAAFPYLNNEAGGNAWFVKTLQRMDSANEEIMALDSLDYKNKAVYSSHKASESIPGIAKEYIVDGSNNSIDLQEVKPNYLKYQTNNENDGFAVFSEIYYPKGWQVFIDGELTEHMRVNYILRGMPIPKGNHVIEFKFDPEVVKTGSTIALASSLIFVLLLAGGVLYEIKKSDKSA